MNAFWLALFSNALLSHSVTVYRAHRDIATKTRIELKPMHIPCGLNDIVKISAPIFTDDTVYTLTKPNGDVTTLNLTAPTQLKPKSHDYGHIQMFMKRRQKTYVTMQLSYDVFSLNGDDNDLLKLKETTLNANEFLLGPLLAEDHGNWVLSAYNMDYNGNWIEMFQVFTVQIIEYVHLIPQAPKLKVGSTLHLQLAYPIQSLTSCQLIAPESSFDRLFERSHLELDRCDFVLKNLTMGDKGLWRIVAVGAIVYEGGTKVTVLESDKPATDKS